MGPERPNEVFQVPKNGPSPVVWWAMSKKESFGPYCLERKSVRGESYKWLHQSNAFLNLQKYAEDPFLNCVKLFRTSSFLRVSIWAKSPPTVGWGSLDAFHGLVAYWILRRVTTFCGDIWKRLCSVSLPTQLLRWKIKWHRQLQVCTKILWKSHQNMEDSLWFVLTEGGGHLEHFVN